MQLDPLTGLGTRAEFDKFFAQIHQQAAKYSLLVVDLDYFKSINDTYGHQAGDEALRRLGACLTGSIRQNDLAFRYGGDEFVILLPDTTGEEARPLAQRLLENARQTPMLPSVSQGFSLTIGVASYPQDGSSREQVFERADQRVFQGKRLGRGVVVAQDVTLPDATVLYAPDRLLERDVALRQVQLFLETLATHDRGMVLQVLGPLGSGHRRLIQRALQMARLAGYAVLFVEGTASRRNRPLSALREAFHRWKSIPEYLDAESARQAVAHVIAEKQLDGLVLGIHNWDDLDMQSWQAIQYLLQETPGRRAVICSLRSDLDEHLPDNWLANFEVSTIRLNPLSKAAAAIWLRTCLGAEPDDELVQAFWQRTGGLPAKMRTALQWLRDMHLVTVSAGRAHLDPVNADFAWVTELQPARRPNLPPLDAYLIGRDREVQQVRHAVQTAHWVTLCGPKGVGKSALALQVGYELAETYAGHVYWWSLINVGHLEAALQRLAKQLQVTLPADGNDLERWRSLVQFLRQRYALILVDQAEDLAEVRTLLVELRKLAPQVRVLITATRPLGLPNELVINLDGLAWPFDPELSAHQAWSYPAMQAILHFSGLSAEHLEVQRTEALRLAQLLNGNPRAMKLACQWLHLYTLPELLAEMHNETSPLGQDRDALGKVYKIFWDNLSQAERQALLGLYALGDAFSLDGAQQVAGASRFFLNNLLHQNLLLQDETVYSLQPDLRFFLQHKGTAEEMERWRSLAAQYYLDALAAGRDLPLALVSGLRDAWNWACHKRDFDRLRGAAEPLAQKLRQLAYFQQGLALWREAWNALDTADGPDDLRLQIGLLQGEFFYHLGQYSQSVQICQQTLEMVPESGLSPEERSLYYQLLIRCANSLGQLGLYDEGASYYHRARAFVPDDDLMGKVLFLRWFGVFSYRCGKMEHAAAALQQSLDLARKLGDHGLLVISLNNMGNILMESGKYLRADQMLTEALAQLTENDEPTLHASVYDSAGVAKLRLGDYVAAARLFYKALEHIADELPAALALEILSHVVLLWDTIGRKDRAQWLAAYCLQDGRAPIDVLKYLEGVTNQGAAFTGVMLREIVRQVMQDLSEIAQT